MTNHSPEILDRLEDAFTEYSVRLIDLMIGKPKKLEGPPIVENPEFIRARRDLIDKVLFEFGVELRWAPEMLNNGVDFTCGCGIYVHPSRRNMKAIHISDCPYAI